MSIEGSRRFGIRWRATLEVRGFFATPETDLLYGLRSDDYISV